MTAKEIILIFLLTPLILVGLAAAAWLALEYTPSRDGAERTEANVECIEENLSGLCNLRYYYEKSKKSTVHLSI